MGSSYTWCNSTRITHFLNRKFMRDPTDKNKTLLSITTLNTYLLPRSHFVCPLFHFEMFQNIVLFLKIKIINLLMFLLYPYLLMFLLIIQFFYKFI